MRKIKKVLDLKEDTVNFIKDSSLAISVQNIKHTPVHYHSSFAELVYCLQGQVNIVCNHESIVLKEGQMFSVDFNDIHCLFSDNDNTVITMHIDLKKLEIPWSYLQYVYFACEDATCRPFQQQPLKKIKNTLLAAAYLYTKKGTLTVPETSSASNKIISLMPDYFDWFNYINTYPNKNEELRSRFQQISAYCQKNYTKKVTISQLAKMVHINENYLSQFIKNSSFGSFSKMMGYIRCFAAQHLLLTTGYSVIEISNQCGFSDDKYFYKNFKLFFNKTPSQYRRWFAQYIKLHNRVENIPADQAHKTLEPYVAEHFSHHILSLS